MFALPIPCENAMRFVEIWPPVSLRHVVFQGTLFFIVISVLAIYTGQRHPALPGPLTRAVQVTPLELARTRKFFMLKLVLND